MTHQRRHFLLPLLLAALTPLWAKSDSWVLPGLANSDGRNGARFESTVSVLNAGTSESSVAFGFVPATGAIPSPASRPLKPGETLVFQNAIRDLFDLEGSLGALTVASSAPLVLGGATRNVANPDATYGVGLEAVRSGFEIPAGATGHAIWLSHAGTEGPGSRANVTVTLLDPGTSVLLEIRDASGALQGSLPLSAQTPVTWQDSVGDLTSGRLVDPGYAVLKVITGRAIGFVSTVDNATGDGLLSTFLPAPSGETDILIDGATRSSGANGTKWTTALRLMNPGTSPAVVSIDAFGVAPAPAKWRVERTVAPSSIVTIEDVLSELGAAEGSAGALRIRSNSPVLALAATTTPDPAGGPGRFGVTQPPVVHRGGMHGPGTTVTLVGLAHTARLRTNFALLADGTGACGTATLRDRSGKATGSVAFKLSSSEWRQKSLPDWFGTEEVGEGSRIDVAVTSGALDAYAPVVDNATGDAAVVAPVRLPASCDGAVAGPAGSASTTLTIGAAAGRIRPLLGVNIGPIPAGESTVDLTDAYHEAGVTTIRTHDYYGPLDMATLYPNQNADPANPASYNFTASDAVFEKILAGFFEPCLRLGDSYSAQPGYPPAVPRRPINQDNWVRAAVEVVRHYDDAARWKGRPLRTVEIWNEPDNRQFWDGTVDEFASLFVKAAKALKQEFPHLLIGGPGYSPFATVAPQGQAQPRNLIAAMKREGVSVDYFSFHIYSNDPVVYRTSARFLRGELDANGFSAVPLAITEWNTETRNLPRSEAIALRTGGRGAAIVSAVQVVLQEEGLVESHVYRGPDPSPSAPEFYGIFYSDGRPKRSALALSLWKRLADHPERLALTNSRASGPVLYAVAGRDSSGDISVLVANPSTGSGTVRLLMPGASSISCVRVDEISDASTEITTRTIMGDTVSIRVSPFCLGAMTFGEDWGWGSSEADTFTILDRYFELGGNFIDTANFYTRGHSEKIIGDYFAARPALRQKAVIATKFYSNLYTGDPNGGGGSRKSMMAALEQSLRRLQADHIDLYWLHCWDRFTPVEETMRALDDAVRAGKIRYIGFSDTPAWKTAQAQTLALMRGWTPLIALQIEYSLLERTVEGELIPMALEMGLGVTPWSPLRSGVLSGKYTRQTRASDAPGRGQWVTFSLTDNAYDVIDVLKRVAQEHETTPARVALAWVQSRPGVVSTIIGARTLTQLEDNLGGLEIRLTPDQLNALDEVSKPALSFPVGFLKNAGPFGYGGTTINGESFPVNPLAPVDDFQRY